MKVLAIMGSPRMGGNTDLLLNAFLKGVKDGGGDCEKLLISKLKISPCRECLSCETNGKCIILDDMQSIYNGLLNADKIVIASPNFFYGFPAQLKALIDRTQALWARKKHILRYDYLNSAPSVKVQEKGSRRQAPKEAFALLLGATGGENLFAGQLNTARYFLESVNAVLVGKLLFRKIEKEGDILRHPTAIEDSYRQGLNFARRD